MSDLIKIIFVGDIMCLHEQSAAALKKYGKYNYDEIFDKVAGLFHGSDYVVGNLETPVAGEGLGYTSTDMVFNTPGDFLDGLKGAGFTFLSTANNHCLDSGVEGLRNTIDNLKLRGFDSSGTYKTKEESDRIFVKEISGVKFAFLCFTYGTNSDATKIYLDETEVWMVDLLKKQDRAPDVVVSPLSLIQRLKGSIPAPVKRLLRKCLFMPAPKYCPVQPYIIDNVLSSEIGKSEHEPYLNRLAEKIKMAKSIADIVIVMPHMGGQFNPEPGPYTVHVMEEIVRSGVDLVVGGHAHTPHVCKCFPNGVIGAYSLGNFCFTPGVGWFFHNALAEYGIVLNTFFDQAQKKLKKVTFSVTKSVVDEHGYSRCVSIHELINGEMPDEMRKSIISENETVVNRFRGTHGSVDVELEYEFACNV